MLPPLFGALHAVMYTPRDAETPSRQTLADFTRTVSDVFQRETGYSDEDMDRHLAWGNQGPGRKFYDYFISFLVNDRDDAALRNAVREAARATSLNTESLEELELGSVGKRVSFERVKADWLDDEGYNSAAQSLATHRIRQDSLAAMAKARPRVGRSADFGLVRRFVAQEGKTAIAEARGVRQRYKCFVDSQPPKGHDKAERPS